MEPGFTRLARNMEHTFFSLFGGKFVNYRLPREELYSTYLLDSIFSVVRHCGLRIIAALAFLRYTQSNVI